MKPVTEDLNFWTFLPNEIKISNNELVVSGWFSFMTVTNLSNDQGGGEPIIQTDVLQPSETPVSFKVPQRLLKKPVDQICAKDVIDVLTTLFKLPFRDIPAAPSLKPVGGPPSKRNKKPEETV